MHPSHPFACWLQPVSAILLVDAGVMTVLDVRESDLETMFQIMDRDQSGAETPKTYPQPPMFLLPAKDAK